MAILIKRGLKANLPVLAVGELALCTDTKELFIGTSTGNLDITVEITGGLNGSILVNGVEIVAYDDTTILNQIQAKSTVVSSLINGNIKINNSEVTVYNDTELVNKSHVHTNSETLNKLSDNGTALLFNGSPLTEGGSSVSEPEFIVKQTLSTTGTHTLSSEMTKFYIHNTGNVDLTFTINSISTVVKPTEKIEDIFDPFTVVTVTATSTFYAEASGLKVGSANPLYSIKDSFTGSSNMTRTFTASCYGLVISNDGVSPLNYNVNGITLTVDSGDVVEKYFNTFTQVAITSTVAFRVIVKSAYLASVTGSTLDTVVPVISANSSGGSFNSVQSVTLSSSETATIYYTLDGSNPTISSTVYSTPISISSTSVLKFFGRDIAGNNSAVQEISFTIDSTAPTVNISPAAGTFSSVQTATLTPSETATIYYTTDGSTPTTSSSVYSSPISINNTTTIKYFAVDTIGNVGSVQTSVYTINLPDTTAPVVTASPNGGTFTSNQTVTLSSNETATIYYTTDGSTPTEGSSVYSSAINISATTSIKFFGKDTSGNSSTVQTVSFTIDGTPPSPVTGLTAGTPTSNSIPVSWTLSTSGDVSNYEVAYSTDATNFTVASAVVNASSTNYSVIGLSSSTSYTIRVVAIDTANNRSTGVTIVAMTANSDVTPPAVTVSPSAGSYNSTKTVTLVPNETATIYYTLDGTTPTTGSTVYSSGITISTTTTLKFFAVDTAGNVGNVQILTYTMDTTPPEDVTNLTSVSTEGNYATISWTNSVSSDVSTIDIFDNTTLVASVPKTKTTYNIYGLIPSTEQTFIVKAKDNATNLSSGVSTIFTTAANTPVIATGYVTNGLTLLLENPANNSVVWNPSSYFNGTEQFTLVTTVRAPKNAGLLVQNLTGGSQNRINFLRNNNNQFSFQIAGTDFASFATGSYEDETSFYHIVVMREGANLKIYVNDVLGSTLGYASTKVVPASMIPMVIGSASLSPVFKNIAYYNRALTTSELTQNYNTLK